MDRGGIIADLWMGHRDGESTTGSDLVDDMGSFFDHQFLAQAPEDIEREWVRMLTNTCWLKMRSLIADWEAFIFNPHLYKRSTGAPFFRFRTPRIPAACGREINPSYHQLYNQAIQ